MHLGIPCTLVLWKHQSHHSHNSLGYNAEMVLLPQSEPRHPLSPLISSPHTYPRTARTPEAPQASHFSPRILAAVHAHPGACAPQEGNARPSSSLLLSTQIHRLCGCRGKKTGVGGASNTPLSYFPLPCVEIEFQEGQRWGHKQIKNGKGTCLHTYVQGHGKDSLEKGRQNAEPWILSDLGRY